MRRLAPLVVVLAVQPLVVLLPTMADAFAAKPHPVRAAVTRITLAGVDASAVAVERRAGRPLTAGAEAPDGAPRRASGRVATGLMPAVGSTGGSAGGSTGGSTGGSADGATGGSADGSSGGSADGREVAVLTPPRTTKTFAVAGVTWTGQAPAGTTVSVRVKENGAWSGWTPVPTADDGPDAGTPEAAHGTHGTDPLLTSGHADGIQVKVLSDTGVAPAGLGLALVDPGTSAADGVVGTTATASAQAAGVRPTIHSRREWGADESLRKGTPTYIANVRAGILHHTAGSNGYSSASVPAQIRGIYAYHTTVRGWNDIAYNVLVDRFGRVWEGRWGGVDRAVQGAHALGFNSQTFGVSAMGNYETATPSSAMLTSIAKVFAWKFSLHRIDPRGRTTLTSQGNLRYDPGTKVTLPTMIGHRDVGPTACPGGRLYAKLPTLRSQVAARVGAEILVPAIGPRTVVQGGTVPVKVTARLTTTQSWKVTVTNVCSGSVLWSRSGTGRSLATSWSQRTSRGAAVPPGVYDVRITARTSTSTATPYQARVELLPAVTSTLGGCPTYRLAAGSAASVADGTRRVAGASRTLVVVPAESARRSQGATAGALSQAFGARLMSSPGAALSAAVAARVRRDAVNTVLLVGTDGTWSAAVAQRLSDLGATVVPVRGTTVTDVLVDAGRKARAELVRRGRAVDTAMLVDPADPVAAAAAANVAGALGQVVLPAGRSGVPAATATAISDLGVTDVVLGGTGGIGPSSVTALRGTLDAVVDVRGATRDAALVKLANRLPSARFGLAVVVPGTRTDGLEAVLSSALGRPQLLLENGRLAAGARTWLAGHGTVVRRIAVAATPAAASATVLVSLNPYVKVAAAVALPTAFQVKGSGFGHGAGMSQYGAYALAKDGASYGQILSTYYRGTTLATVADGRHVKVNLLHSTSRATFGVGPAPGVTGAVSLRLAASGRSTTIGTTVTASVVPNAGGGIAVRRGTATVFTTPGAVHVTWTGTPDWAGRAAVARLSGTGTEGTKAGRAYRYGEMWVVRVGARLEVVNELPIGREYVRGLAEMPTTWGLTGAAALRAQSVAARTYAWAKLLRGSVASCGGCHVYDSSRDQVFRGFAVETGAYGGLWRSAVEVTRGKILTYGGAPAETLYYSSSGGRTQDVKDVFGSARPYLVSVADPYSLDPAVRNPYAAWHRTVTQSTMRSAFGLSSVVSVRVTARTAGKAVRTITATSTTGETRSLTGSQFRSRLRLPATWVWGVTGP